MNGLTDVRRLPTLLMFAVVGIALAVFASVWWNNFVDFDDSVNIFANPNLTPLDWERVRWMLTDNDYARRYMPLGWLCYAIERHWFGLNPHAFHAVNLVLHLANVALLFHLVQQLVRLARGAKDKAASWCAAAASLFWAVNPLRAEVVGWASAVIYEVALLSALAWVVLWLRAQNAEVSPARRAASRWLAAGCFAVSLFTYPLAMFAPVVLFALEVFPLRRAGFRMADWFGRGKAALWQDKVPFLLVAAMAFTVAVYARLVGDARVLPVTLEDVGLFERAMQGCYIWAYYAWKPWVPFNLAAIYPTLHAFDPLSPPFILSAVAVVGTTLFLLWKRHRHPGWLALWLSHLVLLVPLLGLSEYPHYAYDRYSFVQGALWAAALGCGLGALAKHRRWGLAAGTSVAMASLMSGVLAGRQVQVWRDSIPLYQNIILRMGEHPSRSRWDEALAMQYLRTGATNAAMTSFTNATLYEARRKDRRRWDIGTLSRSHMQLGHTFASLGQPTAAATHYEASLRERPGIVAVLSPYAVVLSKLGRDEEAIQRLLEAVENAPGNRTLRLQIAACLRKLGRNEEAERHEELERRIRETTPEPVKL